ncbi:MAG: hypothetical protein CHACPFDD_02677 [Phycisphaerae bacterium]|nr:hypothetical protein [Phycisphaerae bacterium]
MSKLHATCVRVCASVPIAIVLFGCGSSANVPHGTRPSAGSIIAVIGLPPSDPSAAAIAGGARRFAKTISHLRIEFVERGSDDPQLLSSLLDRVLAEKPAAVCLGVPEDSAPPVVTSSPSKPVDDFVGLIERIESRGSLVITYGRRTASPRIFGHVEGDFESGAELLADALPALLAGRQTYVLQHQAGRSDRASQRYVRFKTAAGRRYGYSMLEERNAWLAGGPAGSPMADLLVRFPHVALAVSLEPDVWILPQPPIALPAGTRYATLGAAPVLWPDIRSGRAAALVGPLDGEIGYRAMELAWGGLTGSVRNGEVQLVPCEVVTAANIDDFARRYELAADRGP